MSYKALVPSDDEELTEFLMDYVDPIENQEQEVVTESHEQRGRPRIQERWTRVICTGTSVPSDLRVFELRSDLLLAAGLPILASKRSKNAWAPIFRPKEFAMDHQHLTIQDNRLSEEELMELGRQVTVLRSQYRELAIGVVEDGF